MAGTNVVNQVTLGNSATDTQNFALKTNVDGTMKLARKSDGTGGDILTVDVNGRVVFPQGMGTVPATQSMVRLNTANGYGSTNTMIRRFTNVVTNQGSDITYADSATLGASFTINTSGVYAISYCDQFTAASAFGISLNSAQLTTAFASISVGDVLASALATAANWQECAATTVYLPAGSVVRPHAAATATGTSTNANLFTITRVA